MIQQTLLKKCSTNKVELVFCHTNNGKFDFNPPSRAKQMGQCNAAGFLRQIVRCQTIQKCFSIGAGNLNFCKAGYIHDTNTLTHRLHFERQHIVNFVPFERIIITLLYALPRKPTRAFKPINLLMHSALGFQCLIKWRRFNGTAFKPIEMWKWNLMPQFIVLMRFYDLPFLVRISTKPARIIIAHGDVGRAMHHPAC